MYIYEIVNNINGTVYVGQTITSDRWSKHLYLLARGKHHSIFLQRAWNKYGKDAFSFKLVHKCNSQEELDLLETKLISEYKEKNKSYNILGGGKCFESHEESTKHKISERISSKWEDSEYRHAIETSNSKVWPSLISPEGKITGEIKNMEKFARENNLSANSIRAVCNGTRQHHKGWSLESSPYVPPQKTPRIKKTKEEISESLKAAWANPELKSKISNIRKKVFSDPEYRKEISERQTARMRDLSIRERQSATIKETYEKNRTKYVKKYDVILQSPDGKLYNGIDDLVVFCTEHNLSRSCMHMVIKGKRKYHKGWTKYEGE
jgi:group I intron endonuclease